MIKIIYCVLGISGTGKSTIAREVSKKLNIPIVVSYTSRPIRPNEQEGIDYHYVDNKHFDDNFDDFIEMREYTVFDGSVWKYGYKKSDLNTENGHYLVVIDPGGYRSLKQYFGNELVKPILIDSRMDDVLNRINKRGDNPDEIVRRINDDLMKFTNFIEDENPEIVRNTQNNRYAVQQVTTIIRKGE